MTCQKCGHNMTEANRYVGGVKYPIWLCGWCNNYTPREEENENEKV